MMICPHCQSENREGAKFCNECGGSLLVAADKTQVIGAALPLEDDAFAASNADKTQILSAAATDEADETQVTGSIESEDAHTDQACNPDATQTQTLTPTNDKPATSEDDEITEMLLDDEAAIELEDADAAPDSKDPSDLEEIEAEREALDDILPRIDVRQAGDTDASPSARTQAINLNAANTADLSGFERLVDSSYVPPARSWRSGDTMELPKIEGEPAPAQKKYESPDAEKEAKNRKKTRATRTLIVIVVLAVVAAIALGASYYLELWGGKTVPDVTGEAQADAVWLLESKGFNVDTSQVKSDEVEGIVLITNPASGSRVPEGTTVNISIATPRAVPDVTGKTQDEAKAAFDKEGLDNVTFKTVKSDEAEGTVLEIEPQAGTKVKAAAAITVTVAESYVVPDVTGKSQDDATAALKEAGYAVEVATKYTEDSTEGTVLSTDPAAETKLKSGSTVTITVAKSREKELVSETYSLFSKGATVIMDGINYEVVSCDSVQYEGDGKVSYTITAMKFENTLLFGTIYGSAEQKSGTIKWNSDNSIASAKPTLKK